MGIPSFNSMWKLVAGVLTPTKPDVPINIPGAVTISDTLQMDAAIVDTTLSGTPKILSIKDSDGTPYYFKAYPTKA